MNTTQDDMMLVGFNYQPHYQNWDPIPPDTQNKQADGVNKTRSDALCLARHAIIINVLYDVTLA